MAEQVKNLKARNEAIEKRVADGTAEARARADQLRDLALALADAEARERKRLAQRLHDGFQQLLSAARLKAAIIRRKLTDDSIREEILHVERMVEQAITESRSLATELSPPVLYDGGLGLAVEALARNFEKQKNILVIVDADPGAEPESEQVRVLLFDCVRELLNNVAAHANANEVRIRIGLSAENHVEVAVEDDGAGFDPVEVEREDRHDKPFGLFEIRERLKYIGGGMKLTTAPGQGTKILIFVPATLRAAVPADPPASTPSGLALQDRESSHEKCRILVADDHAIFREGLINLLSQDPDLQVIGEAADGEEAVELAHQLKPDILIVDVTMPRMSGIEVTAKLSREMPGLKIVGLSMHEQTAMASAMRSAGAAAYVTKGGSSEALLALLRDLAWKS